MSWLRSDLTGVGPYTVAELLDDLILPPGEITVQPASWCSFIKLCQSPEVVRGPPRDNSNALVTLTGVSVAPLCPSCVQSFRSPSWIVFSAEIKKRENAWRSQTSGSNHKDGMRWTLIWTEVLCFLAGWLGDTFYNVVLQINCIVFSQCFDWKLYIFGAIQNDLLAKSLLLHLFLDRISFNYYMDTSSHH